MEELVTANELRAERHHRSEMNSPIGVSMTGHRLAEEAVMDTFFTARLPRWPVALFGRNPLVRTSDWVEALVLVLAVGVSLLAAPIAAAVGTAVHDARSHIYAEQAQTRHSITATIIDDYAAQRDSPTNAITVRGRWSAAGVEHTGAIKVRATVKTGDTAVIWVDNDGLPAETPTSTFRAATDAVTAAVAIWLTVAAAAAALFAVTRVVADRVRDTGWQHDIDNLLDGDGHTSQP